MSDNFASLEEASRALDAAIIVGLVKRAYAGQSVVDAIKGYASSAGDKIQSGLGTAKDYLSGAAGGVKDTAQPGVQQVWDYIKANPAPFVGALGGAAVGGATSHRSDGRRRNTLGRMLGGGLAGASVGLAGQMAYRNIPDDVQELARGAAAELPEGLKNKIPESVRQNVLGLQDGGKLPTNTAGFVRTDPTTTAKNTLRLQEDLKGILYDKGQFTPGYDPTKHHDRLAIGGWGLATAGDVGKYMYRAKHNPLANYALSEIPEVVGHMDDAVLNSPTPLAATITDPMRRALHAKTLGRIPEARKALAEIAKVEPKMIGSTMKEVARKQRQTFGGLARQGLSHLDIRRPSNIPARAAAWTLPFIALNATARWMRNQAVENHLAELVRQAGGAAPTKEMIIKAMKGARMTDTDIMAALQNYNL